MVVRSVSRLSRRSSTCHRVMAHPIELDRVEKIIQCTLGDRALLARALQASEYTFQMYPR